MYFKITYDNPQVERSEVILTSDTDDDHGNEDSANKDHRSEGPSTKSLAKVIPPFIRSLVDGSSKLFEAVLNPEKGYVPHPGLGEIRAKLCSDVVNHNTRKVLVWGPGGVGKTELVLEYARKYRAEYLTTFWIEAGCNQSLIRDYVYLYKALYGLPADGCLTISVAQALEKVKNWLTLWPAPRLIVFNNAETLADEERADYININYFVPNVAFLHVIIASRRGSMKGMAQVERVEVGIMNETQALELFYRISQIQRNDEEIENDVKKITRHLGNTVLAITQAAIFIGRSPSPSSYSKKYLSLLKQHPYEFESAEPKYFIDDFSNRVLRTLDVTFGAVKERNPMASALVTLLSFYNYDDILPQFYFNIAKHLGKLIPVNARIENSFVWTNDSFKVTECFNILEEYFLVRWNEYHQSYSMPRLTHDRGHERLSKDEKGKLSYATTWLVLRAFHKHLIGSEDQRRLLPHVMANFRILAKENGGIGPEVERLLGELAIAGETIGDTGWLVEGCEIERYVLKERKRILGEEHLDTMSAMSHLATTLLQQGNYQEAQQLYRNELALRQRVHDLRHPDRDLATFNLRSTLKRQGKFKEANQINLNEIEHVKRLHELRRLELKQAYRLHELRRLELKQAYGLQKRRKWLHSRLGIAGKEPSDRINILNRLASISKGRYFFDFAERILFIVLAKAKASLIPNISSYRGLINDITSVNELEILHLIDNDAWSSFSLSEATKENDVKLVKPLIQSGRYTYSQGGIYVDALRMAWSTGYCKIVEILLNSGVKMNVRVGLYRAALQSASYADCIEVVKLLLNARADVNTQGGLFNTALQAASCKDNLTLIKILLNSGANINAQGDVYGSALQTPSSRGYVKTVQMMLNAGAVVNLQGGPYGNALQALLIRGNRMTTQLLPDVGATINPQGGLFGNKSLTGSDEYKKVIQMLLECQVDSKLSNTARLLASNSIVRLASARLNWLLSKNSPLRFILTTIATYSSLEQNQLADVLHLHLINFAQNLLIELKTKRSITGTEACKFVLYHTKFLASELARFLQCHARSKISTFRRAHAGIISKSRTAGDVLDKHFSQNRPLTGEIVNNYFEYSAPFSSNVDDTNDRRLEGCGNDDSEAPGCINYTVEESNVNDSDLTVQLDHSLLVWDGLPKLFEQSTSLNKLVNNLWLSVPPDVFGWSSICQSWCEELGEPIPSYVRHLDYDDISFINREVIELSDKVKLALERFTDKPWDWWPFAPPKRQIATGKIRLEWNTCCARTEFFDISPELGLKIKNYTQVPVEMRKNLEMLARGFIMTERPPYPQANNLYQAVHNVTKECSKTILSKAELSQRESSLPQQTSMIPFSSLPGINSKQDQHDQWRDGFVLLCVRNSHGPNSLKHGQIKVTRDMTDNIFFKEFRRQYQNLRGRYYWLHYDQFWFCHCSRFYKWDFNKVSWENHEMPKDKSYVFIPKPPSEPYSLPVSRDEWEHRFYQNCSLERDDFLIRIPKREKQFEIDTCINPHIVWGLQVEYRTSAKIILAWLLLFLSPGIVFFIVWLTRYKNDLQNASVPAFSILAFIGILIGLVKVRFE